MRQLRPPVPRKVSRLVLLVSPSLRVERHPWEQPSRLPRKDRSLRKEVLRHLGVAPGQKVEMSLLPNGRLEVRAADWPAIEARLAMLAAGGDFADGAIAFEGRRRGGEVFASFDRTAIRLIAETGGVTHLLSEEQPQPSG